LTVKLIGFIFMFTLLTVMFPMVNGLDCLGLLVSGIGEVDVGAWFIVGGGGGGGAGIALDKAENVGAIFADAGVGAGTGVEVGTNVDGVGAGTGLPGDVFLAGVLACLAFFVVAFVFPLPGDVVFVGTAAGAVLVGVGALDADVLIAAAE
jgi:hypothetical protein